jgi:hypothetical protein
MCIVKPRKNRSRTMARTPPQYPEEAAARREIERVAKAEQRAKKRAAGFVQVSVWIPPEQADALAVFVAALPPPAAKPQHHPGQMSLFGGE